MSERFIAVTCDAVNGDIGYADRDLTKTRSQMIYEHRVRAERDRDIAQGILDARDEDFTVETFEGINVMRNRKVVAV